MFVAVIGLGYVGLTAAIGLANQGHDVLGLDVDPVRVASLRQGQLPIHEPGLQALVDDDDVAGRLTVSTWESLDEAALGPLDAAVVAVGTPAGPGGQTDLSYVWGAVRQASELLLRHRGQTRATIVMKSTVPPGTGRSIVARLHSEHPGAVDYVSCPEFLREGFAAEDWANPHRVVVGTRHASGLDPRILDLLRPEPATPLVHTGITAAELIKYASNSYLALRLSYVNELALLSERLGVDVREVTTGMQYDPRIGGQYLKPGLGWGGSCLPKDTASLLHLSESLGLEARVLRSAVQVNVQMVHHVTGLLKRLMGGVVVGKTVAVLGVTFKPGTDDVRESQAMRVFKQLQDWGARVRYYDPMVEQPLTAAEGVQTESATHCDSAKEAVKAANAIFVGTAWPEFGLLDWIELAGTAAPECPVVDPWRCVNRSSARRAGLRYYTVGGTVEEGEL